MLLCHKSQKANVPANSKMIKNVTIIFTSFLISTLLDAVNVSCTTDEPLKEIDLPATRRKKLETVMIPIAPSSIRNMITICPKIVKFSATLIVRSPVMQVADVAVKSASRKFIGFSCEIGSIKKNVPIRIVATNI